MNIKTYASISLALIFSASLISCALPIPGQNNFNTQQNNLNPRQSNVTLSAQQTVLQNQTRVSALAPQTINMLRKARTHMTSEAFKQQLKAGNSTFSTLSNFAIQSARAGNPLMYGTGTDSNGNTNIIYEIGTTTPYDLTQVGSIDNSIASAFGMAKHPANGLLYYTNSVDPSQFFSFDPISGNSAYIGNINLGDYIPKLGFSRDGQLYASTPAGLYTVDHTTGAATAVSLSNWPATNPSGGDLAFDYYGNLYMAAQKDLYQIDLTTGTVNLLATLATANNIASIGFSPDNAMWVGDYNGTGPTTTLYEVNLNDYSLTTLRTYNAGDSIYDMSSSQWHSCPIQSNGRPTTPTMLFNDDFSTMSTNFANLAGENSPDTSSGWLQWNGDYYPAGNGVTLWNPGTYDPTPGGIDDPNNDVLGIRNAPGEYGPGGSAFNPDDPRPNLLETAIARSTELKYMQGDTVVAKLNVAPTFTDLTSDTTLMLCFDDPAQTVAVSGTFRAPKVSGGQLYVEAKIPDCATQVTVIAMGYLGPNETSSLTFEKASLEFIPKGYYTTTNLLNEPFDTAVSHATYGDNFPALMEDQFGAYDLYLTANWPTSPGDKGLTAANPEGSTDYGGLVKTIQLGSFDPTDTLSAQVFNSSTFTDAASEASLMIEYYDGTDSKLKTTSTTSKGTGTQWRWLRTDRDTIPASTSYVKVVPIFKFGPGETSSFLWDQLSVNLMGENPPTVSSVVLANPADGSTYTQGIDIPLSAAPDLILPGITVEFQDENNNVIGTGTQQGDGSFTATWSGASTGSHTVKAVVKDSGGAILATSSGHNIIVSAVVTPSISITAPQNNWSVSKKNGDILALSADATVPAGGSVRFRIEKNGTDVAILNASTVNSSTYTANWTPVGKNTHSVYAEVLDNSSVVLTSDGPVNGDVKK